MHRRQVLLTLLATSLAPIRFAEAAAEMTVSVAGVSMTVSQVIYPADPGGFALQYWNHDVVAGVQLTIANKSGTNLVLRPLQAANNPMPGIQGVTFASVAVVDSAGTRLSDQPPIDDAGGLAKRASLLWTAMATSEPAPTISMAPNYPTLKAGASASGWLYFVVHEGAPPAWLELSLALTGQANADLRDVPTQQVDPSAYAALNAQRAAYHPELEPSALVVPADQMPGIWDGRPSGYSSSIGQVDATYYDLTDLGNAGRAARFVIRDRKTAHDADVETALRAGTFATFAGSRVDQIDGLGDGIAFGAVYDLPDMDVRGGRLQPMTHVLYGFRVGSFGLELSAYQPGATEAELHDLLDGVAGLQVDRIRAALAAAGLS